MLARASQRGYSSAGRALAWHARGQRFDPAYLHQSVEKYFEMFAKYFKIVQVMTLSSRGLGHHPFTVSTGVRIPVGSPLPGVVVQLVRIPACHAGGRGFESRPLRQATKTHPLVCFFSLLNAPWGHVEEHHVQKPHRCAVCVGFVFIFSFLSEQNTP